MAGRERPVGVAVTEPDADFWTFSLSVYADAGVQAECLDLQDRYGIDVNVVLFCAYAGARHGALLSDADVRQAAELVAGWQHDVVVKLREARRALKSFATEPSPLDAAAKVLREQVKVLELEAEHIEQTMLQTWSVERIAAWPRAEPSAAVTTNIRTLLSMYGAPERRPDPPNHLMAAALAGPRVTPRSNSR